MQTCENCAQPLREDARFCPACGSTVAPLEVLLPEVELTEPLPPAQPVVSDVRYPGDGVSNSLIQCPACGATHDEWKPYCGACGAPSPPACVPETDATTASEPQPPVCRECGRAMRPTQRFCISCGTPNPLAVGQPTDQTAAAAASRDAATGRPDRSRRPLLIASAVTAVLIIAGAGVGIHRLTSTSHTSTAVGLATTPASPQPTVATSTPATTTPVEPAPTTVQPDPQAVAIAQLQAIRAADLPKIALAGQWVAQLASKNPGIVDLKQTTARGDHTFTAADILDEYQKARSNPIYGTHVVLLLSTDYGTRQLYNGQPLWVTVAAVPGFSSANAVNTWCAQQFPTLTGAVLDDSCTPRKLDPPG
jgi:RNA polymerase subunit RPABC4/transcription elongation factor Spt4